jgi:hypothetical protein
VLIHENEAKPPAATDEAETLQPESFDGFIDGTTLLEDSIPTSASEAEAVIPARNPNPTLQLQIGIDNTATRQSSSPSLPATYAHPTMSEQRKQERDFTPEVDAALPVATALAQVYLVFSSPKQALDPYLLLFNSLANFKRHSINCLHWRNKQETWVLCYFIYTTQ